MALDRTDRPALTRAFRDFAATGDPALRDQLIEAGKERFAGKEERVGERELRRKVAQLERALGRKTYELEIAGEALRGWE